jgi:NTE family protein
MPREIQYSEEKEKDSDWNVLKGPIILTRKDTKPKKGSSIYRDFPELGPSKKKKIAVVLSGGGAKGLAHVGVIRELLKYNVEIDFITGTSMGAIVGAIYALEGNLDLIEKHLKYKTRDLITFRDFSFSLKGLFKGIVIEELLRGIYGTSTFQDTKIPLIINAVDLETGKEVVFKEGNLIDAVRASMSIPVVFAPKKIKGKYYVDGGLLDNIPYKFVPKRYKQVVIVDVNSELPSVKPTMSSLAYVHHLISMIMHNSRQVPTDKRIVWVKPNMKNITVGEFDKMAEAIKRGEKAAMDVLPKHFKKIIKH